ncbi:acetyltransferase, GNAT family [Cordyceps fumosorosea ARSEF 2679]|uniref:Acetyltransferase, GNAT family n=1 Tax=Cordyceps fumosorosea (strain ARSEF 2679) TaxID=1081104 RepID=A0A162LJL0_CORFA|nr:acetyltransferase, GNAT family [Cordyceps fumosorosea ARSEF 2679]OAA71464.1 acetyltransferase, GNAT family [Cordyceps fumosorosea ARSEF 2679]
MRRATTADIPSIVDVYMDSFSEEIFSRQVYPRGVPSSTAYWTQAVREEMEEPDAVWFVVTEPADTAIPDDDGNETVQGFLKWTRPGSPLPEPADSATAGLYPPEGEPAVAVAYYERIMAAHRERMAGTPHWYLDMMGVRRACRRRGYARAMVAWGVGRAAQDGCPVYVDATGDARGFYVRMGFATLGELRVVTPQGDAKIYLMLLKS